MNMFWTTRGFLHTYLLKHFSLHLLPHCEGAERISFLIIILDLIWFNIANYTINMWFEADYSQKDFQRR
jgi:hypothetical protein